VSIVAQVTSASSCSALVDIEVYDGAGNKTFQRYYDQQSFTAGHGRQYTANWTVPSSATVGAYTVKIGVFSSGWGTMYNWNNQAAQLTVR
jgi:hypothetical protein